MPVDDPKFDPPPPFRPPEPPPYRLPDRPPSDPPPFRPPDAPPFDNPSRNPWGRGWALPAAVLALVALPGLAHATAAGGGGTMPWDTPLQNMQQDLTGSTATSISLIGVVAIFGVLIFGGELNHFFRSICYVVLLCAVLVAGQNLLTDFGITGIVAAGGWPVPWLAIVVASALIVVAAAVLAYFAVRFLRARRDDRRAAL